MRRRRRARHVTRHLLANDVRILVKGKPTHVLVPGLFLQVRVIDRPRIHPRGSASFQTIDLEPKLL